MRKQFIWKGDSETRLRLQRPCSCGCDEREGKKGVGYIIASDKNGNGVTIWIENEVVYRALLRVINGE